ncbi:MAG TPA: aspartate 1-decarboxylase [Pirellulaceae bacterium]|nr:aspartate 1-decarboxylase [Pirellulaceae bacterium]
MRTFLKSKIHRARVTRADLNYEGSIALDPALMEAAEILPFEKVEVYNINNGQRFATYAIVGPQHGPGEICVNGAAARLVHPDDLIIICCFAHLQDQEIKGHQIRIVHVNDENRVKEVVTTDIMSTWADAAVG